MKDKKDKSSAPRKVLTKQEKDLVRKEIGSLRADRNEKTYVFTEFFNAPPSKEKRVYSI